MENSLILMASGLGGVFLGITLLYVAMHITGRVSDWISNRSSHGE